MKMMMLVFVVDVFSFISWDTTSSALSRPRFLAPKADDADEELEDDEEPAAEEDATAALEPCVDEVESILDVCLGI